MNWITPDRPFQVWLKDGAIRIWHNHYVGTTPRYLIKPDIHPSQLSKPMDANCIPRDTKPGTKFIADGHEAVFIAFSCSDIPVFRWSDAEKRGFDLENPLKRLPEDLTFYRGKTTGDKPITDAMALLGFAYEDKAYFDSFCISTIKPALYPTLTRTYPFGTRVSYGGRLGIFVDVLADGSEPIIHWDDALGLKIHHWDTTDWDGLKYDSATDETTVANRIRSLGFNPYASEFGTRPFESLEVISVPDKKEQTMSDRKPITSETKPGTKCRYMGSTEAIYMGIYGTGNNSDFAIFKMADGHACIGLGDRDRKLALNLGFDPDANYYGVACLTDLVPIEDSESPKSIEQPAQESRSPFGLLVAGMLFGGFIQAAAKPKLQVCVPSYEEDTVDEEIDTLKETSA